ncbi:hypothetical protein JCM8097_003142 [Rhodosporidiobolus ruineniae]
MPGLLKPVSSSVRANLDFLDPKLEEKPFAFLGIPPEGQSATNIEPYPIELDIADLRAVNDYEKEFTVEKTGFQIVQHTSTKLDGLDDKEGMDAYCKETEELLRATLPGAKRVHIFNQTIRKKKHDAPFNGPTRTPENTGPVARAHVDNTAASGARRVFLEMGDDAEALSKGRCQIINVWRPISHPAQDCPLTYMDYRSLDPKNLIKTDLILSNEGNRKGENYSLTYNPEQKWYFLSDMTPQECVVFKIYDSLNQPGISQLTPHSAFVNPTAPADALPRQSIEVRALVFY